MSTMGSTGGAPASTGSSTAFMGWGDDWRQKMVAGSTDAEKDMQQIARYQTPQDIWKKARELERKMSSGELRAPLPKDATADDAAAWRAANGVPAKPEDYKLNLPEGRKPPTEDDAFLNEFRKSAHASNFTQAQMDSAVATFYAEVDRQEKAVSAQEATAKQKADENLRNDWGAEYTLNKNMAEALLARAPKGFREKFLNGRLEDGTPIAASTEAWKWIAGMEREINPLHTVVPAGQANVATAQARLAELKKMMANDASDYWKGPKAEVLQKEYRDLNDGLAKVKAKAA